jgi:hypothetical protein
LYPIPDRESPALKLVLASILRQRTAANLLALVFLVFTPVWASATPEFSRPMLYLDGDTLKVDVHVDSLFSPRSQDAIASGMTTSIGYEFLLEPVGLMKPIRSAVTLRLDHDIWEGRYQVIRRANVTDTLITDRLEEVTYFCSEVTGTNIGTIPDAVPFILSARALVNPISTEQEARTRKWLNLLDRGSILELFFSLEPKEDGREWVEIARFRKKDLPSEVPQPGLTQDDILEGETQ